MLSYELLKIIEAKDKLLQEQNEIMTDLVNKNVEQENLIERLLHGE